MCEFLIMHDWIADLFTKRAGSDANGRDRISALSIPFTLIEFFLWLWLLFFCLYLVRFTVLGDLDTFLIATTRPLSSLQKKTT